MFVISIVSEGVDKQVHRGASRLKNESKQLCSTRTNDKDKAEKLNFQTVYFCGHVTGFGWKPKLPPSCLFAALHTNKRTFFIIICVEKKMQLNLLVLSRIRVFLDPDLNCTLRVRLKIVFFRHFSNKFNVKKSQIYMAIYQKCQLNFSERANIKARLYIHYIRSDPHPLFSWIKVKYTVCPGSSDPFYIVS